MATLLDVLHVVTAVFLVGPMAVLPMVGMRAVRTGDRAQVRATARSTAVFSWSSLLVVVFGFGALGTSDPKFDLSITTGWILASLICYLVALGLTVGVVVPAMRAAGHSADSATGHAADSATGHAADSATGHATEGAGHRARNGARAPGYARIAAGSGVASLLLLVTVVLMVWKP